MPLRPKRVKYRKQSKGNRGGWATSGAELAYGEFGLKATTRGFLTATQIEACRVAINREMKRKGKLWIRVFPDKPVTRKPIEVRMGGGKGNPEFWAVAATQPKIQVHPLGIGGKEDPARLVFDSVTGDGIQVTLVDLGDHFRIICADIELVKVPHPMPKLPVAQIMYRHKPNFRIGTAAWCYAGEGFLSYEEIYSEVFHVLERHPNLNVTFAHLFFMSEQPDRLEALFEKYPRLCVDLAPGIEMFPGMSSAQPRWKEIFTKYADRIVFSTDYAPMSARIQKPFAPSYLYRFLLTEDHFTFYTGKQIQGLGLEKDIVQKILAGNYLRQIGGAPKPICRDALKAYLQKYEPLITHAENKACIFAQCETEGLL